MTGSIRTNQSRISCDFLDEFGRLDVCGDLAHGPVKGTEKGTKNIPNIETYKCMEEGN